ncbi:SRPBCC family protein [Streptomyces solicathayae]|uniref:SRPBCC family protein n=1 Tax=Streptomyces solicathayae TaxID=3081768 RepID=A0ABZ0M2T5_9ACTN|nr:SRPBCC family protein [Streptomyces sp. HUAS YS2]WOX25950.1 SRPBCC family protein [Streptomyces sp. HUAS YS2]
MTLFRIERATALAPGEAWRRLTDWPAHGERVPFTRTRVLTPGGTGVGTRFTARTGIGRAGFDDPMEVVRWEPPKAGSPGVCRLEKHGRTVLGWAVIEVREAPGGGSRVVWTEDLRLRGLPRAADPLLNAAGRMLFGRAMDALLRG